MTERESFRAEAVRTLRREIPDDLEWLFRHPLPALAGAATAPGSRR